MEVLSIVAWDRDSDKVISPERKPDNGEWCYHKDTGRKCEYHAPVTTDEPILVTVTLDKNSAKLVNGAVTVNYTITFSEQIESPVDVTVPISITDRNNAHVDNVGLEITANTPTNTFTGSFTIDRRGDFTVTNEAINFHSNTGMNIISKALKLTSQPWLRIYQ